MTPPTAPLDIQAKLDELLARNPELQKYLTKVYYLPEGTAASPDVTHIIRLWSKLSAERALTLGLVVVPQYAAILDALLSLIATQPPSA